MIVERSGSRRSKLVQGAALNQSITNAFSMWTIFDHWSENSSEPLSHDVDHSDIRNIQLPTFEEVLGQIELLSAQICRSISQFFVTGLFHRSNAIRYWLMESA
jgi:hypothetical protein